MDCDAGMACHDAVCGPPSDAMIASDDGGLDAAPLDAAMDAWSVDAWSVDAGPTDVGFDTMMDAPAVVLSDANIPDAAIDDGSADDAGEAPCTPSARPDLFAWYVGDLGASMVAGRFAWRDQGPMFLDLDDIPGPMVLSGAAAGHDAILVGDWPLSSGSSPGWNLGQPWLVAIVFRVETPALDALFGKGETLTGAGAHGLLISTHAGDSAIDLQLSGETRTIPAAFAPTGRYHVLTLNYDGGSTVRAFVDSRLALTMADATTSSLQVLGAYDIGPFHGAIAEVVLFRAASATAPATDHACIDAYLMQRYAIAP